MNAAQLINQDSGDYEYYTPPFIIEAARSVLGRIHLDPASSETANEIVRAERYLSKDGLETTWYGNVWMNHPFSRESNPLWINKLVGHVERGDVFAACCITYAATSEQWFRPLLDFPQCFLQPRTNYYLPDGSVKRGVTKGSVVTYMGPNLKRFREAFAGLGVVKV